ncbi:MAG: hypothetical protein NVS9B3_08760 [Gemmatimonadaceae bacterium]
MAESPAVALVVDDTPGNRYTVSRLLRAAGMRVMEAATGHDALELAASGPDLVVLDINLPDMSGYEVCREIKANAATSWVPVMHVSASHMDNAAKAYGLELGADAYLTHPLDSGVFVATARALLRLGQAESRLRKAAEEWRTTFDSLTEAIFVLDAGSVVRRCNMAGAALTGRSPRDLIGAVWPAVLEGRLGAPDSDLLGRVVSGPSLVRAEVEIGARCFAVSTVRAPVPIGAQPSIVCLLTDISQVKAAIRERERLFSEAESARREADAANRAKSDFLAVMSHELRTPLNAIAGFVDLITLGIRGPVTEAQHIDLEKIRRSQITLTALIDDLLSFAKLESGSLVYDITDVSVAEAIERAGELIEPQVQTREISYVPFADSGAVVVRADADKLQQILLNILGNALKFTSQGGSITVSCTVESDRVHVHVRDTGVGIPADKLDAIFDPFMQVDQRRVRSFAGIGLGLSISRDLARAMGGDLTVESTLGAGSTFTLTLPRATGPTTRDGVRD